MPLAPIRFLLVFAMLTLTVSCYRSTTATTSPASAAYTDGFEVVVFELHDGAPTNVRSLPLKEAEQAIALGSQAFIPADSLAAIQRQLSTGKSGDSNSLVSVQRLGNRKQQVRVAFHESNRTFVYEYVVEGGHVRPLRSEYHDLAKSKVVRYASK